MELETLNFICKIDGRFNEDIVFLFRIFFYLFLNLLLFFQIVFCFCYDLQLRIIFLSVCFLDHTSDTDAVIKISQFCCDNVDLMVSETT